MGVKPMSWVHRAFMTLSDGERKPVAMVMTTKECIIIVIC